MTMSNDTTATQSDAPAVSEPQGPETSSRGQLLRRLGFLREYGIVFVVIAMFIALACSSNVFLTWENAKNLAEQVAPSGLVACALTFVILTGEFDLSAGAIYVLTGVIAAKLQTGIGTWPALLAAIACAVVLGTCNGVLVQKARINSFVCTLATSLILAGVGLIITKGFLITVTASSFATLGSGGVGGIQYCIFLLVIFFIVSGFILSRTIFGRWVFAVGGNPEAARLSGISVQRVKITVFAISGLAAGIAGAILVSRTATGTAGDGIDFTLSAFAAVVVGGTSVLGGRGAIWRTALGVVFLGLISNGFNLLAINPTYQEIVQGVIVLVAVGVDALSRRSAT
jgi:ribose transport system permease protein